MAIGNAAPPGSRNDLGDFASLISVRPCSQLGIAGRATKGSFFRRRPTMHGVSDTIWYRQRYFKILIRISLVIT
jgi:hypothetical protein